MMPCIAPQAVCPQTMMSRTPSLSTAYSMAEAVDAVDQFVHVP